MDEDNAGWTNGKLPDSCSGVPGSIPGPATRGEMEHNPLSHNLPKWICLERFTAWVCRELTDGSLQSLVAISMQWCHENCKEDWGSMPYVDMIGRYLEVKLVERKHYVVYEHDLGSWTMDELNGRW